MTFDFVPHVSVGPLKFGMTLGQVEEILGKPTRTSRTRSGETRVQYPDVVLAIDLEGKLTEATLVPSASFIVNGSDVFKSATPLSDLAKIDPAPLEYVGILFFPGLGLTLSGFHNEDEKTITALSPGRFDSLKPKFKPYGGPL